MFQVRSKQTTALYTAKEDIISSAISHFKFLFY